jgi:molecular chaperone DnaK (HSP70)
VAFTDTGERLVGQLARRQSILNPKGTITSANDSSAAATPGHRRDQGRGL